jgi:hypothetical protein
MPNLLVPSLRVRAPQRPLRARRTGSHAGFFARLLEKNCFQRAVAERGRFRSFLLKSLNHFLVNDWVRHRAQQRGGAQKLVSLDEEDADRIYQQEPVNSLPPESLYDKRWAMTLLERAVEQLGRDYSAAGKRSCSAT